MITTALGGLVVVVDGGTVDVLVDEMEVVVGSVVVVEEDVELGVGTVVVVEVVWSGSEEVTVLVDVGCVDVVNGKVVDVVADVVVGEVVHVPSSTFLSTANIAVMTAW